MGNMIQVLGVKKVLAQFKQAKHALDTGAEAGMKKAGLLVQRESMKEVPVDTGILRASSFTRKVKGKGARAIIAVGYTAAYAIFVHENTSALHGEDYNAAYAEEIADKKNKNFHSRGAGQKSKFLEDPFRRLKDEIERIIKAEIERHVRRTGL